MDKLFGLSVCAPPGRRGLSSLLAGLACLSLVGSAWAVDPNPLRNAYWRFEEGTAGSKVPLGPDKVLDSANETDAHHLQVFSFSAAPVYSPVVPTPVIPQTGEANRLSLRFSPNQDIYTDEKKIDNPIIENGFTVEAAFMVTTLGRFQAIIGKDGKPNPDLPEQTFVLKVRGDTNELQVEMFDAANTLHGLRSLASLAANRWYYAAVVNDGANLSLWLDSNDGRGYVLQDTDSTLFGALWQGSGTTGFDTAWSIGRGMFDGGVTDWFDGYIDEVRLSNTALDPSDFLFAPNPAATMIHYVDANPDPLKGTVNVTLQNNGCGEPPPADGCLIIDGDNFELGEAGEGPANDGKWSERVAYGNGGSLLISKGAADAEDDGDGILWVSTPTLSPGRYRVYLFFWNNLYGDGDWDCLAALGKHTTMGGLTAYTKANAADLTQLAHLDGALLPPLKKQNSDQHLMGATLGEVTLDSDGAITVSVAGVHQANVPDDWQRTWFDGIGYRLIGDACEGIPAVTVNAPVLPDATSVVVSGISPDAEGVNVYAVGGILLGSAEGDPPNTPPSMSVPVDDLWPTDILFARQVVGGVEQCGPAPETPVGRCLAYVDAVPDGPGANVKVQGADIVHGLPGAGGNFLLNQPNTDQADDGVWSERYRNVNGGNVLVSRGANDAADDGDGILWTSTPTLPAGSYYVYLFFWTTLDGGGLWDCRAGIGEFASMADLTTYTTDSVINLARVSRLDGFDLPPGFIKENSVQDLLAVRLGVVTLQAPGSITVSTAGVHRADCRVQGAADERTWFDGIGYAPVEACTEIPEVTVAPVHPGATSVTVHGVDAGAETVNVYVDGYTLVGSAPAVSPTTVVSVPPMAVTSLVSARQVIGGLESCRVGPERKVALLTYVDATPNTDGANGNTTVDGALVAFGTNATLFECGKEAAGSSTDNLWHWRSYRATANNQANGFNVWETNGDEIPAPLVTTLDLEPGVYNLYGLFWTGVDNPSNAYQSWDASFRVGEAGEFVAFGRQNAAVTVADGSQFENYVLTRSGNFALRIAPLGQYAVSGPIHIYVGSPERFPGADDRTFYEGVAYEQVADALMLPVTDGLGDGDRDNDGQVDSASGVDNPDDIGLKWYQVHTGVPLNHNLGVGQDIVGLNQDNALTITNAAPRAYQVARFPGVMLANPNEFVRLTFRVRMLTPADFGDAFRFGLFSDGGTPILADDPTDALLRDDAGYIIAYATGAAGCSPTSWYSVGYASGTAGVPDNPDVLFGQDEIIRDITPPFDGNIRDMDPHEISLTIRRVENGSAEIAVAMDGGKPSLTLWPAEKVPFLSFNQVAFGNSPAPAGNHYPPCPEWKGLDYAIDDVRIETGVYIPPCERPLWADVDEDTDVDQDDFGKFQRCFMLPLAHDNTPVECTCFDVSGSAGAPDEQVDGYDYDAFMACSSEPSVPSPCLPEQ